jgi:hypothetical protein
MVFVAVLCSSVFGLAGASSAHAAPAWCGASEVQAKDLPTTISPAQCDLRGVAVIDGMVGAVIPNPGTVVESYAMRVDGPEESFAIQTAPDGTVTLLGVGDDPIGVPGSSAADAPASGSGSPAQPVTAAVDPSVDPDVIDPNAGHIHGSECTDGFYRLNNTGGEHDTHKWYMNAGSIPGYFGVPNDTVIARIREGGAHITHGTTDCSSVSLRANLSIAYQGTTTKGAQMNAAGTTCNADGDGQNTVGFGSLPSNNLGFTCDWRTTFPPAELTESDIRFNSNQAEAKFFGTDSQPGTCVNLWDLEGIATHERGHTFGITDIDAASHPDQTMAGSGDPCDNLELRSLGKGDIRGLNDMYNA